MSTSEAQDKSRGTETNLSYWVDRWEADQTGFHRKGVSELFNKYILSKLDSSGQQQCVAFPLCGKTLDMKAVLDAGHRVVGLEGSRKAVEAFFQEHQLAYDVEADENDQCHVYKGKDHPITIFCTDFFGFKRTLLPVDYIWDRGGLVAVTPDLREQYRETLYHLMTPGRTQLHLVAINYDDPKMTGPPHLVTDAHVKHLFESECSIELLEVHDESAEYNARHPNQPTDFLEERLHLIKRKEQ